MEILEKKYWIVYFEWKGFWSYFLLSIFIKFLVYRFMKLVIICILVIRFFIFLKEVFGEMNVDFYFYFFGLVCCVFIIFKVGKMLDKMIIRIIRMIKILNVFKMIL